MLRELLCEFYRREKMMTCLKHVVAVHVVGLDSRPRYRLGRRSQLLCSLAFSRTCGRLAGVLALVMTGAVTHRAVAQNELPVVTIEATDPDASEPGPDTGTFTFTRTGDTAGELTVTFTVGGTATNVVDYEWIDEEVVFDGGVSTATLMINPLCDGDSGEGEEDVTLTLQTGDHYDLGDGPSSATVQIQDEDGLPRVTIKATDPDASEIGLDAGTFTFMRCVDTAGALTVTFTVGGTAANGEDYESIGVSVDFAADASTATLLIRPLSDGSDEGEEDVTLTLQDGTPYNLGDGPSSATVRIQDDTTPPVCDVPDLSVCKNQWMIDAYVTSCKFVTDACDWFVEESTEWMSQACQDACGYTEDAWETICNTTEDTCGGANGTCEVLVDVAYDACLATGIGTTCNATDVLCRGACVGTCTWECAGKCILPWRDKCKTCVSNCSSSCNGRCTNNRNVCVQNACAEIDTDARCFDCNACRGEFDFACDDCKVIENVECVKICEQSAPACIEEKHLGEICNWNFPVSECATGLNCRPDLTSFEGLGPGALIEAILKSTDIESALENIKAASGAGSIDVAEWFCVNDNCRCQEPLFDHSVTEFDAKACMALYRPGRHLQAWLVNDAISGLDGLREELSERWQAAGMPDWDMTDRYQKLAFSYGMGGSVAAGGTVSEEVGSVYGPECFGCYYTLCAGVTPDIAVSAYGTVGVYDASGQNDPAIKNLEGWGRVLEMGGSFPGIEVGASASFVFAGPPGLILPPNKVFDPNAWHDQLEVFKGEFNSWKDAVWGDGAPDPEQFGELVTQLLQRFIPTGRTGGVSIGVGVNPVTVTGELCHTWITESICLSDGDDGGGGECLDGDVRIDVNEPPPDDGNGPPRAICRDRIVAATAHPACNAVVSVDWGSWDPEGNVTLTQASSGPYAIGETTVTLTASDGVDSDTCVATVTVVDSDPPALECPPHVTRECEENEQAIVDPGDATAVDCSDFTISDPPGAASYPLGTMEVTYSATDVAQNEATCTMNVTVSDTRVPAITCPADIWITSNPGQCAVAESFTVSTSDVCDPSPIVECGDQDGGAVDPAGHSYPVGTTTVTCTSTDSSGNDRSCSFDVAINDPPQIVSVTPATQMVQYSDKIVPVVVTATDCGPGNSLTLEFGPLDVPDGLALSSTADSCALNASNLVECTWTLSNNDRMLEPEGDYMVDGIKAVDPTQLNGVTLKSSPAETITVHVMAEQATIAFDGGNPSVVRVATDGGNSGMFDLTVAVQELNPELASAGGNLPGDIGLAVMSMTLAPVGPGGPAVGTCTPDNDPNPFDYTGVLTVTCAFENVEVNTYTLEAVLVANGAGELFYTGSNEDVLVVFDPSLGFTTGGGHIVWPGTGDHTNWGYTMRYNNNRNHVRGSLLLIRHLPDGSKFRIKSNVLFGLAIGDEDGYGWASFTGKCTYRDPGMVEPEGNYEFVTYVEDHGEPGTGVDRFWLQVFDKDDDLVAELSMNETAVSNAETIVGGNIVVPH